MELKTSQNLLKVGICQLLMAVGWKKANNPSVCVLLDLTERFMNSLCSYIKEEMEYDGRVNATIFDVLYAAQMMSISEIDLLNYMNEYGNVEFVYRNLPDYPIEYDRLKMKSLQEATSAIVENVSVIDEQTHSTQQQSANSHTDKKAKLSDDLESINLDTNTNESIKPIKLKILMKGSDVKMSVLLNDESVSKPFDPDHVDFRSDEEIAEEPSSYLEQQNDIFGSTNPIEEKRFESGAILSSLNNDNFSEFGTKWDNSFTCPLCIDKNKGSDLEKLKDPKILTQMICCDNCNVWYHCYCLKVDFHKVQEMNVWYCPKCLPRMNLKHDLRSKNKLTRKHYSNY